MVDLQDANGNSLGITTGSYYIYQSGVQTTHEITEDTTVNDFMAEIANYGIVADVAEDGSIAMSGKKKSFLATSALGQVQNSNVVDVLFSTWNFNNIYDSNNLEKPVTVIDSITRDTKLANIIQASDSAEHPRHLGDARLEQLRITLPGAPCGGTRSTRAPLQSR